MLETVTNKSDIALRILIYKKRSFPRLSSEICEKVFPRPTQQISAYAPGAALCF